MQNDPRHTSVRDDAFVPPKRKAKVMKVLVIPQCHVFTIVIPRTVKGASRSLAFSV